MNWDACAKQRYVILQALAGSTEWTQADAQAAIHTAVSVFPDVDVATDTAALQAAFGTSLTNRQIDGSMAQAMSKAAPMFGVDLSATQPVIAGIKACLAESLAARKAADAKAALAAPLSAAWQKPLVCGSEQLFDTEAIRALCAMAGDAGMKARFGGPLDVSELHQLLSASSRSPDSFSFSRPADPNRPMDMPLVRLPLAGLTVGDAALALFEAMHVRMSEDRDAMSLAITGHVSNVRSMFSCSQQALTVRVRRDGDALEIGYDVEQRQLGMYYGGQEAAALQYIKGQFGKLRAAIADGTPASAVS